MCPSQSHHAKARKGGKTARGRLARKACLLGAALTGCAGFAFAHPHVFVDGRIDFVFDADRTLTQIEVTWRYDPFETLYVLSTLEIDPGQDWTLSETERASVIAFESNWSETFDGAARLETDGRPVPLQPPAAFDARLVKNRLEVRFTRDLGAPLDVADHPVQVTFYEETYFFAFKIAHAPQMSGNTRGCNAALEPFDPDDNAASLQQTLMRLGREDTPEDTNVGRLFSDRIALSCASS
jgi:ABC-type uncharacterized transport system substrate-binding protein